MAKARGQLNKASVVPNRVWHNRAVQLGLERSESPTLSPLSLTHSAAGVFIDAGDGLALARGTFVVEHDAVVAEDFAEDFLAGSVACLVVLDIVKDVGIAGDHADFYIDFVGAV